MAWFRFLSEQLLGLVKETSLKKDLQDGIVGIVKGVTGAAIDKLKKGDVVGAQATLAEANKGAEAIAGAIVKNTPAEKLVDPKIIHGTPEAKAAEDH
jgi:hypothetical protein